ncbi:MAG: transcription antitermination factor NusB [Prevotellaceae bacterium]|nr:transcription antitermination factor NusB [Prevotellaceae bacterium]
MINRILIRIKIVQILYSYYQSDEKSLLQVKKELSHSFDKAYELYFHLLLLATYITNVAEQRIEVKRNKFRPSADDLSPNTRFIDNRFIKQLSKNEEFTKFITQHKLSWANHSDVVKNTLEEIEKSRFYAEYMEDETSDYQKDKEIWLKIFRKILFTNDALNSALEEQSIYWVDDAETIISFILKTIRHFEEENGRFQELMPMFCNDEDKNFGIKLLSTSISSADEFKTLIDGHTKNWELGRIAFMDILIMQIALAEIVTFPTIPVNVTLNEYIEIAKFYSTGDSAGFINGVLDNIVKQLQNEKKLIKVVKF